MVPVVVDVTVSPGVSMVVVMAMGVAGAEILSREKPPLPSGSMLYSARPSV